MLILRKNIFNVAISTALTEIFAKISYLTNLVYHFKLRYKQKNT